MQEEKFVLNEKRLQEVLEKAAQTGAETATKKLLEEQKKVKKKLKQKKLHNTGLLLKNYRMLRAHVTESVYDQECLEKENADKILEELMRNDTGDDNKDEVNLESIKRSVVRTALLLAQVNKMLELYEELSVASKSELEIRRYEILYERFIAEESSTVPEIAERKCVSKETAYADLKIAEERFASLLFGVYALEA